MMRRITAALLALIILTFALPAEVLAYVYNIGEHIWVVGAGIKPDAQTVENGEWEPYTGDDDLQDYRQGSCPKPEHTHKAKCYDLAGNLICGFEEEHTHNIICGLTYSEYDWWVVAKETEPEYPQPGDTDPTEATTPEETVPGSAYFTVRNIDTDGKPLVDSEFFLLEPHEDTNSVVKGNVRTDDNGEADFTGIVLDEGVDSATWHLVQNMPPESDLAELYRPNTDKWEVSIVRNADGTHSLTGIVLYEDVQTDNEQTEMASAEKDNQELTASAQKEGQETTEEGTEPQEITYTQGYDPVTRILTVINEPLLGQVLINVKFEGLEDNKVPDDMAFHVTVNGPDGYAEEVEYPVSKPGYSPWQDELTDLALGAYSFAIDEEAVQVDGYTLQTQYTVQWPGEDAFEADSFALNKNHAYATLTVINRYTAIDESTEPTEGEEEISNVVVVKTVDDLGNKLRGAEFELVNKKTSESVLKITDDDEMTLDQLEKDAVEGQTLTYLLRQTKAPAGYKLSEDSYVIEIKMDKGQATVRLKRDTGILEALFSGSDIDLGSDGEQLATFTNVRKATQIELELDVTVDFMKGSWKDKNLMREYQDEEYEFVLTWEDGGVAQTSETMKLEHGESKAFKTMLPYGARFEVLAVNEDGLYYTYFEEDSEGEVGLTELKSNIQIAATNEYVIEAGRDLDLYLVKVDSTSKKPLEGAKFSLKDDDDDELKTYKTDESGEIDIEAMLDMPGTYTLTEVQAPEGYGKLNKAIEIEVTVKYDLKSKSSRPVLKQTLYADISHKNVELQDDGTYLIKNTLATDNPQTGDSFNPGLWTGALVVSAVGLAAVLAEMKKNKRKA